MDIIIDTNIIRLYDTPKDPVFQDLFLWLNEEGVLVVSQKLIMEYFGTQNQLLAPLIDRLMREKRLIKISNAAIDDFKLDRHYNYTCNYEDIGHARVVFMSLRKRLISNDGRLVTDVNNFKKVDKVKPAACKYPTPEFYR